MAAQIQIVAVIFLGFRNSCPLMGWQTAKNRSIDTTSIVRMEVAMGNTNKYWEILQVTVPEIPESQ